MKRVFILSLFLPFAVTFIPGRAFSQIGCSYASTGNNCQDSVRSPDKYHIIADCYDPVCGCDDKTYRSADAAYWWGAINDWSEGSCTAFDFDLSPNVVTATQALNIRIYMKQPGTASVIIYNVFGRKMDEQSFIAGAANTIIPDIEGFPLQETTTFPRGVYLMAVVVGGEQKIKKFLKIQQ